MSRRRAYIAVAVWLLAAAVATAGPPPLGTASGTVKKATANVLLVYPRGPDGRFRETLVLKLSGTSSVYTVTTQTRGGQTVLVQKETEPRALQPNQPIAVVYAVLKDELVLLSAVAQALPAR